MGLTEKLSCIQQKIKAPKNLYNKFGNYPYRNAEGILEAFKPFESEYKVALIVTDDMFVIGDRVYVKATASLMDCESNEVISATAFAREASEKKGMDDAQITGSASSYARKYALNGLFLLDDTKDADAEEQDGKTGNSRAKENADNKKEDSGNTADSVDIEKLRSQLVEECSRTGRGRLFLQNRYKVKSQLDLSVEQIADAIKHLNGLPDNKVS